MISNVYGSGDEVSSSAQASGLSPRGYPGSELEMQMSVMATRLISSMQFAMELATEKRPVSRSETAKDSE